MALVRKVFLLETDDAVAAEVAAVVDSTGFILKRVESLAAVDRQADPAAFRQGLAEGVHESTLKCCSANDDVRVDLVPGPV